MLDRIKRRLQYCYSLLIAPYGSIRYYTAIDRSQPVVPIGPRLWTEWDEVKHRLVCSYKVLTMPL